MNIELIYHKSCPHVEQTREHLKIALEELGLVANWIEWDSDNPESPSYARAFGSPTILVNGQDVGGNWSENSHCCRLYPDDGRTLVPVPPLSLIITLLHKENSK